MLTTVATPTGPGRVRVYWNSRKKSFSLLDASGKVRWRTSLLVLCDVSFVVRPAGQRRARQTGVKNVHAFAVGNIEMREVSRTRPPGPRVSYNPSGCDQFTDDAARPVDRARMLWLGVEDGRACLVMPD